MIQTYSGYPAIDLVGIIDWNAGYIPVPDPLLIAITKATEYGIAITKATEYGIAITKATEYGIAITKRGG